SDPADIGVIADRLSHNIACPTQSIFNGRYRVGQERPRDLVERLGGARLLKEKVGKRLKSLLAGNTGAGPAFGLVRLVEVLQGRTRLGGEQPLVKLGRELALLLDRRDDGCTAL